MSPANDLGSWFLVLFYHMSLLLDAINFSRFRFLYSDCAAYEQNDPSRRGNFARQTPRPATSFSPFISVQLPGQSFTTALLPVLMNHFHSLKFSVKLSPAIGSFLVLCSVHFQSAVPIMCRRESPWSRSEPETSKILFSMFFFALLYASCSGISAKREKIPWDRLFYEQLFSSLPAPST